MVRETKAREDALRLMAQTSGSQFFLQSNSTSKVCLFFHGFTALPEQFVPIGEAFYKAGYNVLIPLLPGHGLAGNWGGDNPPPLPEKPEIYQEFGIYWLQQAQALGEKVIVGGLSGGSTLAAWLALERAVQINRALLFSPYLSNSNKLVDLIVEIFNIYFEWKTDPGVVSFGYDGFVMPALRVFLDMGRDILELAKTRYAAPMFIISSESDRAVGSEEHKNLFEKISKHQPKSWHYSFRRELDIQHNMMTLAEGNKHVGLVISIAKAYVESDLTWDEVKEIAHIIRKGYSFYPVVKELNLSQRVSPDLATLIEMMIT